MFQLHVHFLEHIRSYNCALSFCSYVDSRTHHGAQPAEVSSSCGPPVYILHGRACHVVGTLTPPPGTAPKFAQLYVYDPIEATRFRSSAFEDLHPPLLRCLLSMLTESVLVDPDPASPFESPRYAPRNPYPAHFANMYTCILQNQTSAAANGCVPKTHVLRFAGGVDKDPRTYAAPTSAEVSCAVVGEGPLPPHFISVYEKTDVPGAGSTHELSALSEHVDLVHNTRTFSLNAHACSVAQCQMLATSHLITHNLADARRRLHLCLVSVCGIPIKE